MATTIQVSNETLKLLKSLKTYERETYDEVIKDLIEDFLELSEETVKEIRKSRRELEKGQGLTLEEVRKRLG